MSDISFQVSDQACVGGHHFDITVKIGSSRPIVLRHIGKDILKPLLPEEREEAVWWLLRLVGDSVLSVTNRAQIKDKLERIVISEPT
jgi:hypothetical protein